MAKTIRVPGPGGKRVQAFCPCGMPANLTAGPGGQPLCYPCAAVCTLCRRALDFADALPLGGKGLAHTACVLAAAVADRRPSIP